MTSNELVLTGGLVAMASGVPALCFPRKSNIGQILSSLILVSANIAGMVAVYRWWTEGPAPILRYPSPLEGIQVSIGIDAINACFLLPVLLLTALASIYGLQYWRQSDEPANGRRVSLFLGFLAAGLTFVVIAQDGVLFLAGWEMMAVSAFFLVSTEDQLAETRAAGWLYLAASHFATLALFGVFALLYSINGSYDYATLRDPTSRNAVALAALALLGLGTKAGVMPVHIWLPSAHAQAPSHVSAIMSGILIKMGIYGLVRVATFYPGIPLSWGMLVLVLGTISAVMGIVFAASQRDLKRFLAYSSIENIGIIMIGLGVALIGRAMHEPLWVLLGICGTLLHVWNHALFKSLLFLGAGSITHGVHTREIDTMGGLIRKMPFTGHAMLVGAIAICGLPPLNGFVSELFIYLGIFHTLEAPERSPVQAAAFAAPALAFVGGLAVASFVKVYGIIFLGAPRTAAAEHAHESGLAMILPMVLLAIGCIVIGVAPMCVVPLLQQAARQWAPEIPPELMLQQEVPLAALSVAAALLFTLVVVGIGWLVASGIRRAPRTVTWDCGYAAPTARMQYTSSSFAEMLVYLFSWALRPKVHQPRVQGLFPKDVSYESHVDDTVLEDAVVPGTKAIVRVFSWSRFLQQGSLQAYLLYILLIIVFLLVWR